jgi:hypothetical protein
MTKSPSIVGILPTSELRAALAAITRQVDDYANRARLPRAA